MKRLYFALGIGVALLSGQGCKKPANDKDAIRTGIIEHLNALKTINVSAMDISVTQVAINGAQAQAQVEFRPKSGAPPGAGMQVSYSLEKRGDTWVVLKSQPAGGEINHPAPGQPMGNSHTGSSGGLPNVNDLLHPGQSSTPPNLPPGHPPVSPSPKASKPADSPKTN